MKKIYTNYFFCKFLFCFFLALPALSFGRNVNSPIEPGDPIHPDTLAKLINEGHLECNIRTVTNCVTKQVQLEAWIDYTFTGVSQPVTVAWSTGVTASKIIVTPPGSWSWDVTGIGCEPVHQFNLLNLHDAFFNGPIDITGPSAICPFGQDELTVNANGYTSFQSFSWSPAYTELSPYPIDHAGLYSLSVTDAYGCPFQDQIVVAQSPPTSAGFSYSTNNQTVHFSNTSTNGTAYFWDFGNGLTSTLANPTITFTGQGPQTVCLTATGACSSITCQTINLLNPLPWVVNPTGSNHTILLPTSLTSNVLGSPLQTGDYIGVFYESSGILKCGGFGAWAGSATATAFAAYGNDAVFPDKNGFSSGEGFYLKIWRSSLNQEFTATAQYAPVGTLGIVTHTNAYANDGISMITALTTEGKHEIVLNNGWNMVSSNVAPTDPDMLNLFSPIASSVDIIKDGDGNSTIPNPVFSLNQIGNWNVQNGYQIKANIKDTLVILGQKIAPEASPIPLHAGWQIIGYLRDSPQSAAAVFASIPGQISLVKDNLGRIYSPEFGINTIGNMIPCQGYKVKALSNTTLTYQANLVDPVAERGAPPVFSGALHFEVDSNLNTGNNAIIVLTDSIAKNAMGSGDEIGVFSQGGVLCGAAKYQEGTNLAITVWGDDVSTDPMVEGIKLDSAYFFRVWDSTEMREYQAIAMFQSGTNAYYPDAIEVIIHLEVCRFTDTTLAATACNSYTLNNQTYTASGTYTQILTNFAGCDSTITLQLTINPMPTVTVNNPAICTGESATLIASGAASYLWNTGATTNTITVSPGSSATYTVTGTTLGCMSIPTTAQVTVNPIPIVEVDISNPTICSGESTTLTASGAAFYVWNNGETTNAITVSPGSSTTYMVTGATSGCVSMPLTALITVNQPPVVELGATILLPAGQDTVLDATCACQSYQWSTGATTASISVNAMGTYSVTVTNDAGCTATDSVVVTTVTGTVLPSDRYEISVSPNPTGDLLFIKCYGRPMSTIQIIDYLGKIVFEDYDVAASSPTQVISLKKWPSGMYYVRVAGADFAKTYPVIKN